MGRVSNQSIRAAHTEHTLQSPKLSMTDRYRVVLSDTFRVGIVNVDGGKPGPTGGSPPGMQCQYTVDTLESN